MKKSAMKIIILLMLIISTSCCFALGIDKVIDYSVPKPLGKKLKIDYNGKDFSQKDDLAANTHKMIWSFKHSGKSPGLYIGFNHDGSNNYHWIGRNLSPGENVEFQLPDGWASHSIWFIAYYPNGHESTNDWYKMCFWQPNLNGTKFRIAAWYSGNRNVKLNPSVLAQQQYTAYGIVLDKWATRNGKGSILKLIESKAHWSYDPKRPGIIQKMPLWHETGEFYVKDRWLEQFKAIKYGSKGIEINIEGARQFNNPGIHGFI